MSMLFPLVLVVMMVGIFASMLREGLWSSLLTLMNTLLAALLATNFFEALATLMTKYVPSGTMFWDIVAVWGIFALAFLVLRAATDQLSKVRVRFKRPIDLAGGYFFAIWTAYVMIAFTTMTLHTAPLGRNFMWGGFKAENPIFFCRKVRCRGWWTRTIPRRMCLIRRECSYRITRPAETSMRRTIHLPRCNRRRASPMSCFVAAGSISLFGYA
jgi:hypothetical protein